jgi:predicted nucleotidyltransferase
LNRITRITTAAARRAAERAAAFLARDARVQLVYLFGSTAHANTVAVRDVDLAVGSVPPIAFEEMTRLRADLVEHTHAPIDLVSLDSASLVSAHEIAETGRCLFARTPDAQSEFIVRARARYWDFRPFLETQCCSCRPRGASLRDPGAAVDGAAFGLDEL